MARLNGELLLPVLTEESLMRDVDVVLAGLALVVVYSLLRVGTLAMWERSFLKKQRSE